MGNILTEVVLTAKELVDGAGAASKQEVENVKSSLTERTT
jgi:hypothetical protein